MTKRSHQKQQQKNKIPKNSRKEVIHLIACTMALEIAVARGKLTRAESINLAGEALTFIGECGGNLEKAVEMFPCALGSGRFGSKIKNFVF